MGNFLKGGLIRGKSQLPVELDHRETESLPVGLRADRVFPRVPHELVEHLHTDVCVIEQRAVPIPDPMTPGTGLMIG